MYVNLWDVLMPDLNRLYDFVSTHFDIETGVSGHGIHAYLVFSKTDKSVKVVWFHDNDIRVRIGSVTSFSIADRLIRDLKHDLNKGNGSAGFIHSWTLLKKRTLQLKWAKHRRDQKEKREKAEIASLPGFGMF